MSLINNKNHMPDKINLSKYILFKKANSLSDGKRKKMINQCVRKNKFHNKEKALEVLSRMKRKTALHVSNPETLEVYLCEYCDGYHIGHIHKTKSF